jgi:hypothetical protein
MTTTKNKTKKLTSNNAGVATQGENMGTQTQETKLVFKKADAQGGNIEFRRANQMTAGDAVQGELIALLPSKFDDKKLDYKLEEVDDTGAKTGKTIVINAAGNLGSRMSNVGLGSLVRIVYLGQSKITKGKMAGKLAHNFDVETADSI